MAFSNCKHCIDELCANILQNKGGLDQNILSRVANIYVRDQNGQGFQFCIRGHLIFTRLFVCSGSKVITVLLGLDFLEFCIILWNSFNHCKMLY